MPDWNCVGGFSEHATATLTRGANTTAYTAQDEVGTGGTAPAQFAVARESGTSGVIIGGTLVYSSDPATDPQFRLLLFSGTVTLAGDNAALELSDTDAAKFIGLIDFDTTQAGGTTTAAPFIATGIPTSPISFECASGSNVVYGVLITRNAFTPIANSETIKIGLRTEQN